LGQLDDILMAMKPNRDELEQRAWKEKEMIEGQQAVEALKGEEERLRTILKSVPAGIVTIDAESHTIVDVNPTAVQMIGIPEREIVGQMCHNFICPEQECRCPITDLGQTMDNSERVLIRPDGKTVPILKTVASVTIEGSKYLIESFLDISALKRAQEALRQSNEILKHILSASPIGIGLVEDRTIRWANEAALKIFGFEHEQDYVGRSTRIVYPSEEEYERVGQIIYDKLKAGKTVREDAMFKRQDGTTFVGHLMISCPDPSDPMKTAIFTISDISWREHAEQERIQREKLQGVLEMAGAVCHELNQPLQVVSVCSERLLNAISEDSPLYNQAQKIAEKFDMIVEITRKLQSMTKYETKHYVEGTKIIDIDKASRIT